MAVACECLHTGHIPGLLSWVIQFYFGKQFGGTDEDMVANKGASMNSDQIFIMCDDTLFVLTVPFHLSTADHSNLLSGCACGGDAGGCCRHSIGSVFGSLGQLLAWPERFAVLAGNVKRV